MKNEYKILVRSLIERSNSEELDIDGSVVFNCKLGEYGCSVWIGLI
jgi:hypothetical protein